MKKLFLAVSLVFVMASSSMAMLSMGVLGAYYSFSGGSATGVGAELGIGLIPFVDTRLVVVFTPGATSNESLIPATLNFKFGLPGMPIYFDGGVGYVLYSNSTSGVTPSGAITYNAGVGYENEIMPFTKLFVQGGFEGMTVSYTISGTKYEANYSGLGAKAGIRFSI